MRLLVTLVALCATAFAQVNAGRPDLDYGYVSTVIGGTPGIVTMGDGVQSGELIVVCASNGIPSASPVTFPISDSAGNTYTNMTPLVIPQGSQSANAEVQISYAIAGGTVSSLTISGLAGTGAGSQGPLMTVGTYKNISSTTDGTGSATSSSNSNPSLTANVTTTVNADLIIGCSGANRTNGLGHSGFTPGSTSQYVARDDQPQLQSFQVAGVAGSQSVTHSNTFFGGGQPTGLAIVAFKPSGIAVATTTMPDGGAGTAYSARLVGVGGAGAYTWSALSGLPAWASLNASTGVVSGANPTAGTSTVNFQVTDGTLTATKSLTIKIGSILNAPSVRTIASQIEIGTGTLSVSAYCGDSVLLIMHAQASHGTHGWVRKADGTNNYIHDTYGLTPQRAIISGSGNGALLVYIFGPIPTSGVETLTFNNNDTGSSLGTVLEVVSGAQALIDDGTFNSAMQNSISSSYTLASSYTTTVPNELLHGFFVDDPDGSITVSVDTITFSAPLSVALSGNQTYDNYAVGSALIASPSTITTTANVTTSSVSQGTAITQFALRPSIFGGVSCPVFNGLFEKIRRQVY